MDKEKNPKLAEAALKIFLNNTSDLVFIKNTDLVYLEVSQAFAEAIGKNQASEIIGQTDQELFADAKLAKSYTELDRKVLEEGRELLNYLEHLPNRDGQARHSLLSKYPLWDESGKILGLLGMGRELKSNEEYSVSSCDLSLDPLTGLSSRLDFYRQVRVYLDEHPDDPCLLLRFDLDRFKVFNDVFGTKVGDQLLKDIGQDLNKNSSPDQIWGRLEADHFVGLIPAGKFKLASWLAEKKEWLSKYPTGFRLHISLGVYLIQDPQVEVSLMCDRAFMALRTVKDSYSQKIAYYNDKMRDDLVRSQALLDDVEQAFLEEQFILYFQPQVDYDKGSLIGAEALVRWQHPQRGLLSPGYFIPLFEKNGLISRLDEYVWEKACACIRSWLDQGIFAVPISVNISRLDIYDAHLDSKLKHLIEKYHLSPTNLNLEITESAYVEDAEQLLKVVESLQVAGFIVEMDDFGSGYSSLNTLKDVPVDILKLDLKFLSRATDESRSGSILSSIIRMAHWLKLPIIAEGVDSKIKADYLKSLGCIYMQGYYFDRPMPEANFLELLKSSLRGTIDRYQDVNVDGIASFWDASAQTTLLFNSFVGGAAIMEYQNGNLEAIRINDNYFRTLGISRQGYADYQLHILRRVKSEYLPGLMEKINSAINLGKEESYELACMSLDENKENIWLNCRFRILAKNADRYLLYVTIENITGRKQTEENLRVSQEELELAISRMGKVIVKYDIPTRTVISPKEYAQKHNIPVNMVGIPNDYDLKRVVPADRARYIAFYNKIIAGEKGCEETVRVANADGSYSFEHYLSDTVFDHKGQPSRAIIAVEDVTLKMEREAENERNRLLIERAGICALNYDVITDTLHFQTYLEDQGSVVIDVPNYYQDYLNHSPKIHPQSRAILRQVIEEASQAPITGTVEYQADNWNTGYRWCRLTYIGVTNSTGQVYQIVGQALDIEEEKNYEALLMELQACLGSSFGEFNYNPTLLGYIFTHLYESDDIEKAIQKSLEILGSYYCVSRVYIFEDIENHTCCRNTFEWCAEGVEPQIANLQRLSYERDLGGTYHSSLNENGVFYCTDISTLPETQYQILAPQGIKSMLQCAILDDGVFSGYIGFDECRENRIWNEEQISTLTLIARLVGFFLLKQRKSEAIEFFSSFWGNLENNPNRVYVLKPENYQLVYVNQTVGATEDYLGKTCYQEFFKRQTPCESCPVSQYRLNSKIVNAKAKSLDGRSLIRQALPLHWQKEDLFMIIENCCEVDS